MNRPTPIVCYLPADQQVGSGHLVRSKSIIEAFSFPHQIYRSGNGDLLKETFPDGIELKDPDEFAASITRLISIHSLVILWVDAPEIPKQIREIEHERLLKIIVDDYGGFRVRADVIVNGNAGTSSGYNGLPDWALILEGLKYMPIRPEFSRAGNKKDNDRNGRRVGFVVGSGDEAAEWGNLLLSLNIGENKWSTASMVVPRTLPEFEDFLKRGNAVGITPVTGLDGNEMAAFYSSCDVCVMTAGMCLYEALAVGTPIVAYPVLPGMEKEAAYFESNNAILNLGKKGGDIKAISDAVNCLLDSSSRRTEMCRQGRRLFDGKGAFRISRMLLKVHAGIVGGGDKGNVLASVKKEIEAL